ncbi:hypothetical protein NZD89_11980 [Alicyclobacillus fastidiosus]|uniref:Uncharacterized protein n=2 Tax=Alicyclobacillus fastidiosus TaxID=392011 RepID=A0ABY6ZMF7_9BACL|nr:hypothetical protein [Alicyclobacillus fastidiosus]WAH44026.1 hypothetical protein NZD89_11980 [Alicyclobacillus fastidiosus]
MSFYYRHEKHTQNRITEIINQFAGQHLLSVSFGSLPWEQFVHPMEITEEAIGKLVESNEYGIVYNLMQFKLISDSVKNLIREALYHNGNLFRGENDFIQKFLLLKFFATEVDEGLRKMLIDKATTTFCSQNSSRNLSLLTGLGGIVTWISAENVQHLLEACQNKMKQTDERSMLYARDEIVTAYLIFIYRLDEAGKLGDSSLFNTELERYKNNLSNTFAVVLEENPNVINRLAPSAFRDGILIPNPKQRRKYIELTGRWLAKNENLTDDGWALLEIILAGFYDSNVEVASESIRAVAFIVKAGQEWILQYRQRIVDATAFSFERNDIRLLTNLAFLYKELSGQVEDDVSDAVNQKLAVLRDMHYANVRREVSPH